MSVWMSFIFGLDIFFDLCGFMFLSYQFSNIFGAFVQSRKKNKTAFLLRKCSTLSLVEFSCSVMSDSLRPYGLHAARLPCLSPTPGACSNLCPLSWWCHPTSSSFVVLYSFCLQSFPASGSFPVSEFFSSGGHSIGVSASATVLPMNIEDWFPLGLTSLISLQSKGLWRVFSNTTVQKQQFFGAQHSLWSNFHIHTWLLEKTIALTRWTFVGKVMSLF